MSNTLYERYDPGDEGSVTAIYGVAWKAQTFTIGNTGTNENHKITSVKLKLYRLGSPGTVTVSVRAVDGNGKPTGSDLISGTTNGNTLTTNSAGEWREILLDSITYELSAGTKYAIVTRVVGGTFSNSVSARIDTTSPTYTGGIRLYSSDSGVNWTDSTSDIIFYEYGTVGAVTTPPVITNYNGCTASGTTSATVTAALTAGSGNTQIYYGTTNEGEVKSAWHYSSSKLLKYNGNNWSVSLPVAGDSTPFTAETQYYYIAYVSSNAWGAGEDWAPATTGFVTAVAGGAVGISEGPPTCRIYYSCNQYPNYYIDCAVTRWQENSWDLIIETFMGSSNRNTLANNIVPSAYRELYNILGTPKMIDITYNSGNTLRVCPNSSYNLSSLREERIVAVKSFSDRFISQNHFGIKLDLVRIDI